MLSSEILARPVAGSNLTGDTLGQEIGDRLTLLVFLRHFG
jgi:hypothetical protein